MLKTVFNKDITRKYYLVMSRYTLLGIFFTKLCFHKLYLASESDFQKNICMWLIFFQIIFRLQPLDLYFWLLFESICNDWYKENLINIFDVYKLGAHPSPYHYKCGVRRCGVPLLILYEIWYTFFLLSPTAPTEKLLIIYSTKLNHPTPIPTLPVS